MRVDAPGKIVLNRTCANLGASLQHGRRIAGRCVATRVLLATGDFMSSSSPLEASVLVLNKMFMAVHVISVRRAFCLLAKQQAEVVSVEDGQYL